MNSPLSARDDVPVQPDEAGIEAQAEEEEHDDSIIGKAFTVSLAVIMVAGGLVGGLYWWLNRQAPLPPATAVAVAPPKTRVESGVKLPAVKFTDITRSAGVQFVHENGATGEKLLPETMGAGCAFFDFDNDGDQDLLLANGNHWPWNDAPKDKPAPTAALYANDGQGILSDVTTAVGLAVTMYGQGIAVGDYDNDGWQDVYLTGVGGNKLFRNEQGKFRDTTAEAGVGADEQTWSTSASFLDYDRDGDLDLFVCTYVRWSREVDQAQNFRLVGVGRAYGPPLSFDGSFPRLFRNEGGGKFVDVSKAAGVQVKNPATGVPMAKSLGLAPVDIDRDGWIDLVVANDTVQNFVFHNEQGKFQEIGALTGVGFDSSGNARGAMGIDVGAFRNNQALGIVIGNFANEMTSLYVSQTQPRTFVDEATATGLGPETRLLLKFGVFFFDYDLDGRLDVLTANGHLEQEINKVLSSQQYEQPPQLFWNCGAEEDTEFRPVLSAHCGEDLVRPMVGRGSAYADLDGDGDLDVVLTSVRGAPRLLRNDQDLKHHWLRFKLVGSQVNRDAIGAWIEVVTGKDTQRRQVMPTRSYLSQSELPVTFGLGKTDKVERVTIEWPDGTTQRLDDVKVDALNVVTQPKAAGASAKAE